MLRCRVGTQQVRRSDVLWVKWVNELWVMSQWVYRSDQRFFIKVPTQQRSIGITIWGLKIERRNTNQCLSGIRIKDQGVQSAQTIVTHYNQTFLVKSFFLPSTAAKTWRSECFQESFEFRSRIWSSFPDFRNKNGNVHYYCEVEFNGWNDW